MNIIPKPAYTEERYGEFFLNKDTKFYADSLLAYARDRFAKIVSLACTFEPQITDNKDDADILFLLDRAIPDEGYVIDATSEKIIVSASSKSGALYAVQSLRQLMDADLVEGDNEVLSMHAVYVKDEPRYEYRALMLDESRHFFGPEVVKEILSVMAYYKLNVFHWHLTDNQGWRIEIKKYPKLTEIGSIREGTQDRAWGNSHVDNFVHEGFYTQQEIKEIVSYATKLGIIIVPEIDMPAHLAAAIAAYPELGCFNKKIKPFVKHSGNNIGENKIIACAGNSFTYQFIYDIIDELVKLFPAPYFHIGGDEAPKSEWVNCPNCQKVIKENKLKDEEALQSYLTNKIAVYLKRKGKRLMAWNEVLKGDNLENTIVPQYWTFKSDPEVQEWLDNGGNVVISKHQAFYFDMTYAQVPLKNTYNFEPENYGMRTSLHQILGVEGTLWTEWIPTQQRLEFQMFPRIQALSETAWTPKAGKNYLDFLNRVKKDIYTLKAKGKVTCPLIMTKANLFKKIFYHYIFCKKNAHIEYEKALKYRKKQAVSKKTRKK